VISEDRPNDVEQVGIYGRTGIMAGTSEGIEKSVDVIEGKGNEKGIKL
jgi:hypothetical protein